VIETSGTFHMMLAGIKPQVRIYPYDYFINHQGGIVYLRQPIEEFDIDVLSYYRNGYNLNPIDAYKTAKKLHKK